MRRLITYLVLIIGCFWGGMSLYISFKPRITVYTLNQIKNISGRYSPVQVEAKDISLSFFAPGVVLSDIKLIPQTEEYRKALKDFSVDEIRASVNLLKLLGGQVQLSSLTLDGIKGELIEPSRLKPLESEDNQTFNWAQSYEQLLKLPLSSLVLTDVDLKIVSGSLRGEVRDLDILIDKGRRGVRVKSFAPKLALGLFDADNAFSIAEEIEASFNQREITIKKLRIRHGDSHIDAQGVIKGLGLPFENMSANLNLDAKAYSFLITEVLKALDQKSPTLQGFVATQAQVQVHPGFNLEVTGEAQANSVSINQYVLGDIKARGQYKNQKIDLKTLDLNHPSGQAQLTNFKLALSENLPLEFKAQIDKLDLNHLFHGLGLGFIPVHLDIHGQLPCQAKLKPLDLNCSGKLKGKNLAVYNSSNKNSRRSIVALPQFDAEGSVRVTSKEVTYEANLAMPQSQGKSSGRIHYQEGFDINYEAEKLSFSDVSDLVQLSFEGNAKVKGRTWGTSRWGKIDMEIAAVNFWFENYGLGEIATQLKYDNGLLSLNQIQGKTGVSRYEGYLGINLALGEIATNVDFKYLEVSDILSSLSRKFTLPFEMTGSGNANIKLSGPLDISKLSYDFSGQMFRGKLAGESFDRIKLALESDSGQLKTKEALVERGQGRINMRASMDPAGQVDAIVIGENLMLDEFDHIANLSAPVSGDLDFRAAIKGPINRPKVLVKGSLESLSLAGRELASSLFNLDVSDEALRGSLSLVGNKVQGDFQFPFSQGVPLLVNLETNDWDFSTLLSLLGGQNLHREYSSTVTSQLKLTSLSGNIWESTGSISVPEISLQRQQFGIKNTKPIEITFNDGRAFISHLKLEGPASSLEVTGKNFTKDNLAVNIKGHTDLKLLHIFAPFLEDLAGPASLSVRLGGKITKPEMLGSAFLDHVYIKLPGFPHPLERVRSDILFSQQQVLINSLKGQLAGGVFTGEGTIGLQGVKNLPMNIKIRVEGANLHIPTGVKSTGVADLTLTGDWFPFTIGGEYRVNNALIDMAFGGGAEVSKGPKRSVYLPEEAATNSFEPIEFDMQILLNRNIEIKNALLQGQLKGALRLQGTPSSPSIMGEIQAAKEMKVFFREKIFEVSSANVRFNKPGVINPDIFLSASSRVQEWDVNLLVQGSALDPQIRLSSTPPLSEEDLISLLALGIVSSTQTTQLNAEEQQRNSQYQIGSALYNQSAINKEIQERLGLEIVISSAVDDTRVVPMATVSRKLTKDLTASYSQTLGENHNNAKLRYRINQNVTAIGSWDSGEKSQQQTNTPSNESESILGVDLEYRVEFE